MKFPIEIVSQKYHITSLKTEITTTRYRQIGGRKKLESSYEDGMRKKLIEGDGLE